VPEPGLSLWFRSRPRPKSALTCVEIGAELLRPSSGTVRELRKVSTEAADTVGKYLDAGHDWLYRRLHHWFEDIDVRFAHSEQTAIVVPLSPLRIGLASEFVHRQGGFEFAATPDFEAAVRLPNLERRLKVFVTSDDLQESPGDPVLDRNPVRAGVRFAPQSHIGFEFGVRARIWPAVFAALRWTPEFHAGVLRVYPFVETYAESGLGFGTSGGIAFERWSDRWTVRSASYANWVRLATGRDLGLGSMHCSGGSRHSRQRLHPTAGSPEPSAVGTQRTIKAARPDRSTKCRPDSCQSVC
jgi:hypothetical protein